MDIKRRGGQMNKAILGIVLMVMVMSAIFMPLMSVRGENAPTSDPYGIIVLVKDENGNPIEGARVDIEDVNQGTNISYITDEHGYVSMDAVSTLGAKDGDTIKITVNTPDGKKAEKSFTADFSEGVVVIEMTPTEAGTPSESRATGSIFSTTYGGLTLMTWIIIIIVIAVIIGAIYITQKNKMHF